MIRSAIAHLLHAIADRIEVEQPEVEIQYVYVYSAPPQTTIQPWPMQPWQTPITWNTPHIYSSSSSIN